MAAVSLQTHSVVMCVFTVILPTELVFVLLKMRINLILNTSNMCKVLSLSLTPINIFILKDPM